MTTVLTSDWSGAHGPRHGGRGRGHGPGHGGPRRGPEQARERGQLRVGRGERGRRGRGRAAGEETGAEEEQQVSIGGSWPHGVHSAGERPETILCLDLI